MRVMSCYSILVRHDIRNLASPELLMSAIATFGDPIRHVSNLTATKPVTAGSNDSLNSITDNYAWGISSYARSLYIPIENETDATGRAKYWSNLSSDYDILEQMVHPSNCMSVNREKAIEPIIGSLEFDASQIYSKAGENTEMPIPVPAPTALVDNAIDLFSYLVLEQPAKIQESAFAQIAAHLADSSSTRNPTRKLATTNNIVVALSKALSRASQSGSKSFTQSSRVTGMISDILNVSFISGFVD